MKPDGDRPGTVGYMNRQRRDIAVARTPLPPYRRPQSCRKDRAPRRTSPPVPSAASTNTRFTTLIKYAD